MAYPKYNLLVAYLVVHSFPAVEPVMPAVEPAVPTTEPVAEPVVPFAEPSHIAVSKAISKCQIILSVLLRHRK